MKTFSQVVKELPHHLKQYVVEQDYSRYTPLDQATWRFILRQLKSFLTTHAHESYVEGLEKTGISVEEIPNIEVMCEKLQQFGWMAVPVSGFIPPAAFMEMQSLSLLPIACDMRSIDHILYTPAPDIVHEAAGHAPILVNPQFASYLKDYAQISKKAIISSEDLAQYEAIRDLSDIKESPTSTPAEIAAAEKRLTDVNNSISHISEAALLGRMNWWTAEYGLIGDLEHPKIFGAGLLSSLGEASQCLSAKVKKIPLSVDCVDTTYDITEQQPQLFVAKDFSDLSKVLHQLEDRLAFKKGGTHGMLTAQKAKTVNTIELNSGLQISGKLKDLKTDAKGQVYFYKLVGPVQLCENGKELPGQGNKVHAEGFSSPLGLLEGNSKCLSEWTSEELKKNQIEVGRNVKLLFVSGITVTGDVTALTFSTKNKLMILGFKNCTAKLGEETLYSPDWGTFDMAVGSRVVSVFAGPADRETYGMPSEDFVKKLIPKKNHGPAEIAKHAIYKSLRDLREKKVACSFTEVEKVFSQLKAQHPDEWLAFLELLELSYQRPALVSLQKAIAAELQRIQALFPGKKEYIDLGLELANKIV
jgi:phenylalanine-4-hydroxylase